MAHKEWEPDEFLDEFLDFDYRKPVPGQKEKSSKGLPAAETKESVKEQKRYGLDDDYKLYDDLRHSNDRNAGNETSVEAEPKNLRSSDALFADIPAPLSAKKAARKAAEKPDAKTAPAAGKAASVTETPASDKGKKAATETAANEETSLKNKVMGGLKRGRASELAAEALGAAKKLVSTDEDLPPEVIPPASSADISEINGLAGAGSDSAGMEIAAPLSGKRASGKRAGAAAVNADKDELAELFEELGETSNKSVLSNEDNQALAQAQNDAYDRYRSNYMKKTKKKSGSGKAGWFARWISRLYVIALAAFAISMTVMNVLPFGTLIAVYVILGILSVILVIQLRKSNVKKWARALASVTAILLIGCFGLASVYAMGTLSFLDFTSVENENRVASITKEPFNVCITGIDVDGKIDKEGRSDVNMIVTVNPKTEQILLTSIPRDYQIYMPDKDYAMDKLTHTGFYGVETTIGAEEELLGTKINYYVKVNFTTVKKFIDAIGGVDVYSEYEFTPVKMKSWTVQKGWNHMNGKQALAFARERKAFIDGDNQRIKNQQAVFEAIIKKATSSKTMLLSYNKILSNLRDYFLMSFSSAELRSLFKLQLAKDPDWKIHKNTIIGGNGSMPTYSTGGAYAYVMTQDQTSIDNAKSLINGMLEGKILAKDDDDNVYVTGGEESGDDGETEGE